MSQEKITLDRRISIGSLIQAAAVLIAIAGAYYALKTDLALLEAEVDFRIQAMQAQLEGQEKTVNARLSAMEASKQRDRDQLNSRLDQVMVWMHRIEDKLDRYVEGNHEDNR